ncbi:MAG: hypothetical protein Q9217_006649, partial [Psora testacea]
GNVVFGAVVNQKQVEYGFGRHLVYVKSTAVDIVKWTIIAEIQSYSAVLLVKLSVCLFILRVIKGTHRNIAKFIYVLMVLMTTLALAAMLTDALQCFPLEKAWRPKLKEPLPVLLAKVSPAPSNQRIRHVSHLECNVSTFSNKFPLDDFVPVEIWAGVESNFGLTVACLPALRPLFVNILNGTWSGSKPTSDNVGKTMKPIWELHNKALGCRHSDSDSDKNNLNPLGSIAVSKTTEVESEHRQSSDMESSRDKGGVYHSTF